MRLNALFLIFIFINFSLYAQVSNIDSLDIRLKNTNDDSTLIHILNDLAFLRIHSDPQLAKDDVAVAYDLAISIGYEKGISSSLNTKGSIEWALGNYNEALRFYFDALEILSMPTDELEMAKINNNIGEIYKKLNEPERALGYLRSAAATLKKYNLVSLGYNNIGEAYLMLNENDSALHYFLMALNSNKVENNKKNEAYAYHGLGRAYLSQQRLELALDNAERSMQLRLAMGDIRGTCYAYILMAEIFQAKGLYKKALTYLNLALTQSEKIEAVDVEMDIMSLKSDLFESRGILDSALHYYKKFNEIKERLLSKEKATEIARIQSDHETAMLRQQNEASTIQIEQRNTIIFTIVVLFILAVVTAGAFYKQRMIQQKVNELLMHKNDQMHARSEEIVGMNKNLEDVKNQLEIKIRENRQKLKDQNNLLAAYAYSNAHELRAPVASIMGLVNLLDKANLSEEDRAIVDHLNASVKELDKVVCSISERLENTSRFILDE